MKIKPYSGKYAVKYSDFFERVHRIQSDKMNAHWRYCPINSEIEITNACNQNCRHCGIAAMDIEKQHYEASELIRYIDELNDNGVVSFSITGGEPFLEFENMLQMMNRAVEKVDLCKITTNGFWGKNADEYFDKMVKAGLLKNRLLVPCLMVSIGEQVTPMEYTCNIFHLAIENFDSRELTLCISSLSEYGEPSKVDLFVDTYKKLYGSVPSDRIFLTENYYRTSSMNQNKANHVVGRTVSDYMTGPVRCFEQTIGKYILPRLLIKATGQACTCACFNPPKELYIGNFRENSITEILEKINQNSIVNIIAENGLHGFKRWVDFKKCKNVSCNNECEACSYLIHQYKNSLEESS